MPRPRPDPAIVEAQAAALRHQAGQFAALGSPVYATLAARLAEDVGPAGAILGDDAGWDIGLRLFAGVHHLVLTGPAPDALDGSWESFAAALAEHEVRLATWMAEQGVQTNEVQRCIGLLPAFLTVALETGLPLELLELGPSAGLNLLLDRYRYRYTVAEWGPADALVVLDAVEERPVPRAVLRQHLRIRRRRGVDLSPIDATTSEGLTLLRSFLWPGREERARRLEAAVETLLDAPDPPELIRGDYVASLPGLLTDRPADAVTVVFQTASTGYVPREARDEIRASLETAASDGRPLAWVSARNRDEREGTRDDAWELELRIWPGPVRHIAHLDFHGNHLEWLEPGP